MKRLFLLGGLFLALAACSGHTVHRLEVDFLSFVPQADRSGELMANADVKFPDDPAGQPIPVPGAEALLDGQVQVRAEVANTGTLPATLDLEVRMGPESDTNLYDNTGGDLGNGVLGPLLGPGPRKPRL